MYNEGVLNYSRCQQHREQQEHEAYGPVECFYGDLLQDLVANSGANKSRQGSGNEQRIINFRAYFQNICSIDRETGDVDEDRNDNPGADKDLL